jgi:hypothetical protein
MVAHCAILVAYDLKTAEQFRDQLRDEVSKNLDTCSFEECRQFRGWHKPGIVLVFARQSDSQETASLIREAKLRRSELDFYVVRLGEWKSPSSDVQQPTDQFNWPDDEYRISQLLQSRRIAKPKEEPLTDILAGRLALHTPSLLPQIGRLALAASHDITVLLTGETGDRQNILSPDAP